MASLFCCNGIQPFRPAKIEHELKFMSFLMWGRFPRSSSPYGSITEEEENRETATIPKWPYALQLVRQVNYGPLESKRYFVPQEGQQSGSERAFKEVLENDLLEANFSKVNSYKNFRCDAHNKFFEMNLYAKDPVNKHHWRVNIARPADDIDLVTTGDRMSRLGLATNPNPTSAVAREESEVKEKGKEGKRTTPPTLTSTEPTVLSDINSSTRTSVRDREETQSFSEEDSHFYHSDYQRYSENEDTKDYTACSKECGYCGECDY